MSEQVQHENRWYGTGVVKSSKRLSEGYELRYLPSGDAMLKINMCIKTEWEQKGDLRFRNTYVPLVAWADKAEEFAKNLYEEALIKVAGEFRTSSYEKDGNKVYTYDFQIFKLEVLEGSEAPSGESQSSNGGVDMDAISNANEDASAETEPEAPRQEESTSSDVASMDVNPDDIPF